MSRALPLSEQKIALKAESSSGKENVFWYLDDKLIASGPADKTCFMEPVNGMHMLRLVGSGSGFDSRKICIFEENIGISRQ